MQDHVSGRGVLGVDGVVQAPLPWDDSQGHPNVEQSLEVCVCTCVVAFQPLV